MHTILLVDDFKPNLRILEETFREAGFQFQSASSVDQAEAFLRERSFDLVLTDIQMPGANGFDLLAWIQSQKMQDLPVLFITSALPEAEHRIRGLSLGAVDYVERSLAPDELVLRVRKAIEHVRQLKNLKISLEDSEKLASLGRIIAASNHEIKNLTHIVRMSAERLAKHPTDSADELNLLLNASGMLADVTRSMNSLLKGETAAKQSIDLAAMVRQMIQMTKSIVKDVALEAQFGPNEEIWVNAAPTALKQVLLNLILNARDAIHEKGERAGLIRFSVKADRNQTSLHIIDNGMGLAEAGKSSDFPAFRSTKRLRGGTGLGLWLSARLLDGMGSKLELSSEGPGTGVTATVSLQSAEKPAAPLDLSAYLSDL